MSECSVDGCNSRHVAKGLCSLHYQRLRRNGNLLDAGEVSAAKVARRFSESFVRSGECWKWAGNSWTRNGYGVFSANNRKVLAHRFAWSLRHGQIPAGMQVDHKCHNRACVNPDHLQIVTQKLNQENRSGANGNSSSGIRGVFWDSARDRWRVAVTHKGKEYGGRFRTRADAEARARELRSQLHTNSIADRKAA